MSIKRPKYRNSYSWRGRIIYIIVYILMIIILSIKLEWRLPSVKLSQEVEVNSFSTLTDLADEYVDKHTIGTYKLSYLSLEYDKALNKCVDVHFEYCLAFPKHSCRISFNPVTGEMVGKWSNQQVNKDKLNIPAWDLQLEDMIKGPDLEWSSFTIIAISDHTDYEGNYDYIIVNYYNGEEEVMSDSFKADDLPVWLK